MAGFKLKMFTGLFAARCSIPVHSPLVGKALTVINSTRLLYSRPLRTILDCMYIADLQSVVESGELYHNALRTQHMSTLKHSTSHLPSQVKPAFKNCVWHCTVGHIMDRPSLSRLPTAATHRLDWYTPVVFTTTIVFVRATPVA